MSIQFNNDVFKENFFLSLDKMAEQHDLAPEDAKQIKERVNECFLSTDLDEAIVGGDAFCSTINDLCPTHIKPEAAEKIVKQFNTLFNQSLTSSSSSSETESEEELPSPPLTQKEIDRAMRESDMLIEQSMGDWDEYVKWQKKRRDI